MKVKVNGDTHEFKNGTTVTQMLQCFDIESKRMAIEINGHVVKRSVWPQYTLSECDQIEILEFVGGG